MNWKNKTFLFYGIGGLLIGIIAAIITINNAEEKNKEVNISFEEGAKIGVKALNAVSKIIIK